MADLSPYLSWSYDSEQILFVDIEDGELDIFSVDIASSEIKNLTASHGNDHSPVMQP